MTSIIAMGWRAGMSGAAITVCPFTGRWRVMSRMLWRAGWQAGLKESLQRYLTQKGL